MKRRIVSLILALAMLLSVMPAVYAEDNAKLVADSAPVLVTAAQPKITFSDTAGLYYSAAAERWARYGVISGIENGVFGGQKLATRSQVAKIVALTLGYKTDLKVPASFYTEFTDAEKGAWYIPFLYSLNQKGIMKGDGAGKIRPNDLITRQEFLVLTGRAAGIPENASAFSKSTLTGKEEVASWAKGYMGAMIDKGIIKGDANGNLNATADITRGEIVTVDDRLVSDYINVPGKYAPTGSGVVVVATSGDVEIKADGFSGNIVIAEDADKPKATITGGSIGTVLVNGDATVSVESSAEQVIVAADTAATVSTGENAVISSVTSNSEKAIIKVSGKVENLTAAGGTVTVDKRSDVEMLGLSGKNMTATVLGTVSSLATAEGAENVRISVTVGATVNSATLDGKGITIADGGKVVNAYALGQNITVSTPGTNVTAGEKSVSVKVGTRLLAPGETTTATGSSVQVVSGGGGGGGGGSTGPANFKHQLSAKEMTVKYGTVGKVLTATVTSGENQHYSYQWYRNTNDVADTADAGAAKIEGAINASLNVVPEDSEDSYYYFCEITAYRGTGKLIEYTDTCKVTFTKKQPVNILVIGSYPIGSYNMYDTLGEMVKDKFGVPVNVQTVTLNSVHSNTSSTFNLWEMFTNSNVNNDPGTKMQTAKQAAAYDYLVIQNGRDLSLTTRSSRNNEKTALKRMVAYYAEDNVDMQTIIMAPYGHTVGFSVDFSLYTIRSHKAQVGLIDSLARNAAEFAAANESLKLNNPIKIAYVGDAFEKYSNGDDAKLASVLFRPDNGEYRATYVRGLNTANRASAAGAYLAAAVIFAKMTGVSAKYLTTYGTTNVNANLDNTSNEETLAVIAASGKTVDGLRLELQTVADAIAFAVEPKMAEYTVESYVRQVEGVDYELFDTTVEKDYEGVEKVVSPVDYEDRYYVYNMDEITTAVVNADGTTLFKLYYDMIPDYAITPVFIREPSDATAKFIATTQTLSVQVQQAKGNTYTYQWYKNDTQSNEGGTAVAGATDAKIVIPKGEDGYYYCEVTAHRFENTAKSKSAAANVIFSTTPEKLNGIIFGGHPVGTYYTYMMLRDILADKLGVEVNLQATTVGHGGTATTYNAYELIDSAARGVIDNYTFASGGSSIKNMLTGADKVDFVVMQTGRDFSMETASSATGNEFTLRKVAKLLADNNPDAQYIVYAPYAHTVAFDIDFKNIKTVEDHTKAINKEAETTAAAINADGYLSNKVKTVKMGDAFAEFVGKDYDKLAKVFYRPDNNVYATDGVRGKNNANTANAVGAYFAGSILATAVAGKSVVGSQIVGVETADALLTSTTNTETLDALEVLNLTGKEAALELQAAAEKFVLGTTAVKASYSIEFWGKPVGGTDYTKFDTKTDSYYAGQEYTITAPIVEDYLENAAHPDRVVTAVVDPAGTTVFKLFYDKMSDDATKPVITKDLAATLNVRYGTNGKLLKPAFEEVPGNTYTFKWYVNDTNSVAGATEITGETGATLKLTATNDNLGTKYYFADIIANRKGNTSTTQTAICEVTFEKTDINVILFGGYTVGSGNAHTTLDAMLEEKFGVNVNVVYATIGHTVGTGTTTYNAYELFDASCRSDINNIMFSTGEDSGGKKIGDALASGTEYDYIIIQSGRDFSITSSSSKDYNIIASRKIAKVAAGTNPDAQFIVLAPYAHTMGFATDFSAITTLRDFAAHTAAINAEAVATAEAIDKDGYLNAKTIVSYVSDAFAKYADGDAAKIASVLYRPDNGITSGIRGANFANRGNALGGYLTAATMFASVTGQSPVGLTTIGSESGTYNSALDGTDPDIEVALKAAGETVNGIVLELQALAEKTVLGTEPAKANYKVEYYWQNAEKTGFDLKETVNKTAYVGKEVLEKAKNYLAFEYMEDKANASRVEKAIITQDGLKTFKFYYINIGDQVIEPTLSSLPATLSVNSLGKTLKVAVEEPIPNHTYDYQWYENTTNSTEGAKKIDGETSDRLVVSATTENDGTTLYYFCEVTANNKEKNAAVKSSVCAVSFEVKDINAYLFGGFSIGSYNVYDSLKLMLEEQTGVTVNMSSGKPTHDSTWSTYNLWETTGYLTPASEGTDVVFLEAGRDISLVKSSSSDGQTREQTAFQTVVNAFKAGNPDVQIVIYTAVPNTVGFATEADFGADKTFFYNGGKRITDYATHAAAIQDEAQYLKEYIDTNCGLNKEVIVADVIAAFNAYAGGDAQKIASDLYRPTNNITGTTIRGKDTANRPNALGAYLEAATIASAATGKPATALTTLGTENVNANLNSASNTETTAILTRLEKSAEEIAAILKSAADKAVFGK